MNNIVQQLDPIFKPKSIALIGASNNIAKWGGRSFLRLLASDFKGAVYPVNPRLKELRGIRVFADIADVPYEVDLAIITIPSTLVPDAITRCAEKGVRGAIVITADFAETSAEGKKLEQAAVDNARRGGLRFIGPNCLGIWSSAVGLSFSFTENPKSGALAFISQSGSYGGSVVRYAESQGFGLSKFISIGNQADITVPEYLDYLAQDDDTKVIALYLEGVKDGRQFLDVARRVTKQKPVLLFKGGSSPQGAKATLSHTASIAGEDIIFDAMCRQAGVIRVSELHHILILAEALISQPLPKGNRISVTGTGGQGVVTVDALYKHGLDVPQFKEEDQKKLKSLLSSHAPTPNNPVDFAGGVRTSELEAKVSHTLASIDYIDGIITSVPVHISATRDPDLYIKEAVQGAELLARVPREYQKPLITQLPDLGRQAQIIEVLRAANIPIYSHPEDSARAMAGLVQYANIKNRTD
jgi:acyl-CoA synthetase (NDP forming)